MTELERKRWMRYAAIALVGGGVAVGGWVGLLRPAAAEPVETPAVGLGNDPYPERGSWTRSPNQPIPSAATPQFDGDVIPASGMLPPIPAVPAALVPDLPQSTPTVPQLSPALPALIAPPADSKSACSNSGDCLLVGAGRQNALPPIPGSGALPTVPNLPSPEAMPSVPAIQTSGALPSVPTIPSSAALPSVPANAAPSEVASLPPVPPSGTLPAVPNPQSAGMIAAVPSIPAMTQQPLSSLTGFELPQMPPVVPPAAPPATPGSVPALPKVPPAATAIAPPAETAPSTPTLQFPDTIQPVMPVQPDYRLQNADAGINVKSGNPAPVGGVTSPLPSSFPTIPSTTGQNPVVTPNGASSFPSIPGAQTGTVVDRPKPVDGLWPSSEKDTFTLPSTPTHEFKTSGDSNMTNLQRRSAALAVIGGMLFAPATPIAAGRSFEPYPTPDSNSKETKELKEQIDEANKKLSAIQKQLEELSELLKGKKDADGHVLTSDPGVVTQMKILKDRLESIEKDLAKFNSQSSTSQSPAKPTTPNGPSLFGSGTVRVMNEYPIQISMVVNGLSYKLEPATTRDIAVPSGEFTYQLLNSGAAATKSYIKDKETVTLRIK